MALRQILSKTLLPNLDRDLHRVLATEMDSVSFMVENPLASQVFGYAPVAASGSRSSPLLGRGTSALRAPAGRFNVVVKKYYPSQTQGLMQDPQPSFHHLRKRS
jgi:hypothetical protein